MTIPDHRLSTEVKEAPFIPPDGNERDWLEDFEKGPIALNDTSEGINYQDWHLTWDDGTGDFTVTPDVGSPSVVLNAVNVISCSFAFDNAAHVTIAYVTTGNVGHLYWYDTVAIDWVTTDFIDEISSMMLALDDKRETQTNSADVVLLATYVELGQYNFYSLEQRDRYLIKYPMLLDTYPYIYKYGMHEELRGQIVLASARAQPPPIVPPGPADPQANLDFELGDVYWEKTLDFSIDQSDPFGGSWSAILDTNPANYSTLENSVYTAITPGDPLYVSCVAKGTIATDIILGFKFYNAAKSLISQSIVSKSITTNWVQISHTTFSPASAVYIRIFVTSNATDGIVSLDNFSYTNLLDTGQFYTVELDIPLNYNIELDTDTIFEVEL